MAVGDSFTRRLSDDTVLVIDESIRVRITPGSAERDQFAKLGKVQDDFTQLCASFGVAGIEEAREQLSRRGELEAALAAARATISAALDGEDPGAVRERIAALRACTDQYRASRTATSAVPLPGSLAEAESILESTSQALKQARTDSEQAERGRRHAPCGGRKGGDGSPPAAAASRRRRACTVER